MKVNRFLENYFFKSILNFKKKYNTTNIMMRVQLDSQKLICIILIICKILINNINKH